MKRIGYILLSAVLALMLLTPVLAQEGKANPLAGYTAGLNVGYPIVIGEYFKDRSGPIVGIVGNTPYGFAVGPFNIGVGFGVEATLIEDETQVGVFGSINTTLYVTPYGPLAYYGGVGYYNGLGLIGGIYYEYMVPNIPLVIKPYARALISTAAEDAEGNTAMTGYGCIGVMAMYDISTLIK